MTPLEAALIYASRGWLVFPIKSDEKVPTTKRGYLDATTDVEIIKKWWTLRRGWDKRNVGIVTSRRSGIWVLDADIDMETGETIGEDSLAALLVKHGPLPPHPIARTPNGGKHHVFAYPIDGDLPRRIKFAPGLDALGSHMEGEEEKAGYFVAYPSRRIEGDYVWEVRPGSLETIPLAPSWLIEMIRTDAVRQVATIPIAPTPSADTKPYGRAALTEICREIATCAPGSQDDTLLRRSRRIGRMVAGGSINEGEAFTSLVAAGMQMTPGREPWSQKDVEKKVRRGMEHGFRDPHQPKPSVRPPTISLIHTSPQKIEPEKIQPKPWEYGLPWICKPDGTKKPKEAHNCQLMIEHHPDVAGLLDYNEFSDQLMLVRGLPGDKRINYPRFLTDDDITEWTAWINQQGLSPSYDMVQRHMHAWAKRNGRDPLKEYLNSLKWDGKPRIDMWLSYYCDAEANDYTRAIGRKFLIGAAARGLIPGSKVDSMLIWEGIQGIGKSTGARALFGDQFFSDQIADVRNKEGAISLQGIWCIEVAEMDKFGRVEANAVKSFLTHNEDRYRPHYGRHMVARPRRCVFLGTINPDGTGYLRDPTGNRRFWPVEVKSIDVESLKLDRDQLWAEAVTALRSGEKHWLDSDQEKLAAVEQEARQEDELREPEVIEWVENQRPEDGVFAFTIVDCLKGVGITGAHQNSREANSARRIVKKMGCYARSNWANRKGRFWVHRRAK